MAVSVKKSRWIFIEFTGAPSLRGVMGRYSAPIAERIDSANPDGASQQLVNPRGESDLGEHL